MWIARWYGLAVLTLFLIPVAGARADQAWAGWSWGRAGRTGIGMSTGGAVPLPPGGYLLPDRLKPSDAADAGDFSIGSDLIRRGITQPSDSGRWTPGAMACVGAQCQLYSPGQAAALFGYQDMVHMGEKRHEIHRAFERKSDRKERDDRAGH